MEREGSIGLFYFAGHGVQLAWRNYLIPVDAVVDNEDDIRARAVDLNALLAVLTRAKNPMNVIILDACRDNPFGRRFPVGQRGLSQFDAPPGSLLAYATAPGHVASDGDGEHGLYTENLVRELKVPEARIEDVFKRVRLQVRRRTNGGQIPWESTSLEEDFYFIPPKSVAEKAERQRRQQARLTAAAARQFEEELALWDKVRAAAEPQPLEAYLLRYPSGRFAELAQLRLDRVLAARGEKPVQAVAARNNPYSQGSALARTRYQIGDTYRYRVIDLLTRVQAESYAVTVAEITDDEVRYDNGEVTDLLGNAIVMRDGRTFGPSQFLPRELALGRRWTTRFRVAVPMIGEGTVDFDMRIAAREHVKVPAGVFDAFRIDANGWAVGPWGTTRVERKVWLAPDRVRRFVASEIVRTSERAGIIWSDREELVSWQES